MTPHFKRISSAHGQTFWRIIFCLERISVFGQWLCGSVGRVVASNTRGPRFESSHRQNLFIYWTFVFCQLCIEKTKIKKKMAGNGPFFGKILSFGFMYFQVWTKECSIKLRQFQWWYFYHSLISLLVHKTPQQQ